jgi:hypothetical protein
MSNQSFPNRISNPLAAVPVWDAGGLFVNYAANNAGVQIKLGAGVLQRLVINTAGLTSQAVFYDGTSTGGIVIGTFATLAQGSVPIGAQFVTGLFVVIAGGTPADLTIVYK